MCELRVSRTMSVIPPLTRSAHTGGLHWVGERRGHPSRLCRIVRRHPSFLGWTLRPSGERVDP
jgi:hypothetical protein